MNHFKNPTKEINSMFHTPLWLFVLMICVLVLRIPSFLEPYSYGDEMIYLSMGEAVRQGIPLYKELHDNKPPLLYLVAAAAGSLFWFKAFLAIWHLVTIYVFWKLAQILFPIDLQAQQSGKFNKENLHKIATVIFAIFTTLPLLEGNIANAELFMIGPTILGFYILLSKRLDFKNILFAGASFSIATLFKVPAAFDFPTIVFYWLATNKLDKQSIITTFKRTLVLSVGFIIPIALTFVWYFYRGALKEYVIAAFLQNVGYLSSWRPDVVQEPFLVKNGPLLVRAAIVSFGYLMLFLARKKLSKQFLLLTSWLLLTLFAVTLSERPYPHYLIQSIPPASILAAMLFTVQNIEQVLTIIPLTLLFVTPVYYKFWNYPTLPYYEKFLKFAVKNITKDEYFTTFGGNVAKNYKIANFIVNSTYKTDKIFVWGDGQVIYALSKRLPPGKYLADYHIKDFSNKEETLDTLTQNKPKLVVVLPESDNFPALESFLRTNYFMIDEIGGGQIWILKRY
jgi:hypothetical protein